MPVDRPTPLTSGPWPLAPRRRGFTMIEMIVVMAIIVILLGIVVVGFRHVAAGNQKRQTQTLLERLKNVTTNTYNNKAASQRFFQQQLPTIYNYPVSNLAAYVATPSTPLPALATPNPNAWDAVPAAADDSLFKTGMILRALLVDPEAKRIFDDLPSERKKVFYFQNSNGVRVDASVAGSTTTFTLPLDAWGNPILFVYDDWSEAATAATNRPHLSATNTNGSAPSSTGGLTELYSESTKTYWQFTTTQPPVLDPGFSAKYIVRPGTTAPASTIGYTRFADAFRSPDNRPFWASAGPDGNYATHDDNVYSFEN